MDFKKKLDKVIEHKMKIIKKRNQIIKNRQRELAKFVMCQTNYTEEEALLKLKLEEYNYMKVIRDYMNPNKEKEKNNTTKKSIKKSINQRMMGEIRKFMDDGMKQYERRKQINEYLQKRNSQMNINKKI